MGFVLSRKKIKIKNILPNNPEIASTTGQIISRKDEGFGILCFEINCDGFLPTLARPWLVNSPCTRPPTPVSYYDDSRYDCQ